MEIGRLAEQYSKLSLSGSFSGQIGMSVRLFETRLKYIVNTSDPESVKQTEESLNRLKEKLNLLHKAAGITSIDDTSIEIERKFNGTLTRMEQLTIAVDALKILIRDSNGTELVSLSKALITVHSPVFVD